MHPSSGLKQKQHKRSVLRHILLYNVLYDYTLMNEILCHLTHARTHANTLTHSLTQKTQTNTNKHKHTQTHTCSHKHTNTRTHVHCSPNPEKIVLSDELSDKGTAFSPGGRRSSVGSSLKTPIRPFVLPLNVSGAPTVTSSCSAFTPIVNENPAAKTNSEPRLWHTSAVNDYVSTRERKIGKKMTNTFFILKFRGLVIPSKYEK